MFARRGMWPSIQADARVSLQDWLDRGDRAWEEPDKFATLFFIVRALHAIHAAGMALCDLSLASFAWWAPCHARFRSSDATSVMLCSQCSFPGTWPSLLDCCAGLQRRRTVRRAGA